MPSEISGASEGICDESFALGIEEGTSVPFATWYFLTTSRKGVRMSGISHCSNEHNGLNVLLLSGWSVCSLQARTTCPFQHVLWNPESEGPNKAHLPCLKRERKEKLCEDEQMHRELVWH